MVARTVLTYDGLEAAPNDGLRRELLGGDLYVSPAPSPMHQRMVGAILVALDAYTKRCGGEAFTAPIDVVFSQTDVVQPDVVQPDVLYLAPDRLALVGLKNVQGAPSLIIEVLSPSSSDVDPGPKLDLYARYGVPEYWIVDPTARAIVAHTVPIGGRYTQARTGMENIESLTLKDLRFSLPAR